MCLIVDANTISLVLAPEPVVDFLPIQRALFAKRANAVHGGKLTREYLKLKRLARILKELDRQGILRKVPDSEVDALTTVLCKERACVSDDEHIIALARVSGVRLLCSLDKSLHKDFTNPALLKPPGSVYQRKAHEHLIRRYCSKKGVPCA
jgi:hypothetical protein